MRNGRFVTPQAIIYGICLAVFSALMGCAATEKTPPMVTTTQLAQYENPAKPPDCSMPILETMPPKNIRQIAIVEAWADLSSDTTKILPLLKRKACATGADALVIVSHEHQDIRHLLYGVTPNQTQEALSAQSPGSGIGATGTPGAYLRKMEHRSRIGEAGHNGFYIDAIAIDYRHDSHHGSSSESQNTTNSAAPQG